MDSHTHCKEEGFPGHTETSLHILSFMYSLLEHLLSTYNIPGPAWVHMEINEIPSLPSGDKHGITGSHQCGWSNHRASREPEKGGVKTACSRPGGLRGGRDILSFFLSTSRHLPRGGDALQEEWSSNIIGATGTLGPADPGSKPDAASDQLCDDTVIG